MALNYCPNCGARIEDQLDIECSKCGCDFTDLLGDDDDDDDDELDLEDEAFLNDDDEGDDEDATSNVTSESVTSAATSGLGSQKTTFWRINTGKIIRWVIYLPVLFVILGVVEFLLDIFLIWLFDGDMRTLVIVGIFFGGIGLLWPLSLIIYIAVYSAIQAICPVPKVGAVIFGTLYVNGFISTAWVIYSSGFDMATVIAITLLKIAFLVSVLAGVVAAYSESK